jgi:hypothetical protein
MPSPNLNLADVEFICERLLWSLRSPPKELMDHIRRDPMEAFHTIPRPDGGFIIIGRQATERFTSLTTRYLASRPDKKARVDPTAFQDALRNEFSLRFIKEEKPVDQSNTDLMLNAAYEAAARKFDAFRHFIPCTLFYTADAVTFDLGPVTFVSAKEFFSQHTVAFEKLRGEIAERDQERVCAAIVKGFDPAHARTAADSAAWGNHLVNGLLESFQEYSWFASVAVPACDPKVSYERALFLVKGALNIIKLLLGARYTHRLRTAEDQGLAGKTAKLHLASNGDWSIELSGNPKDNTVGDNWLDYLRNETGHHLPLAARALELSASLDQPPPLCTRYIDALYWFGDAIAERSPAARIVKFVSAIERVTGTGEEKTGPGRKRGVTEIVTVRAAILHSIACQFPFAESKREISAIYTHRSNLVHGSISPFDEQLRSQVVRTHEATRMLLLVALDFFVQIGLEKTDMSDKRLEQCFVALEEKHAADIADAKENPPPGATPAP